MVVNGTRVRLTQHELSLLHTLMENAGRVLSRGQLMEMAWGDGYAPRSRMVDVYVLNLQRRRPSHT